MAAAAAACGEVLEDADFGTPFTARFFSIARREWRSVDAGELRSRRSQRKSLAEARLFSPLGLETQISSLNVVVQRELERMGTQADGVHFLLTLVINIGLQELLGEDIAFG